MEKVKESIKSATSTFKDLMFQNHTLFNSMWALTRVKRQSLSVSAFLSQSSITSYDGHKIFQPPRNHEVTSFFSLLVPLLFPTAAEDSTTPFILSISPTSTVLKLLSASPLGFYCLTHAHPKAPENVLLKHILPPLQTSQFLTGSWLKINFQTVLLSPAPRFPGLSAAMPCLHLTFRILDHIPNSQTPHLIPEALPELTRTSDLFSPLLRHSDLFSLNCGNSPRVLAKTHTWVRTPWLHLYFLTSQILFSYIYTIVLILWF